MLVGDSTTGSLAKEESKGLGRKQPIFSGRTMNILQRILPSDNKGGRLANRFLEQRIGVIWKLQAKKKFHFCRYFLARSAGLEPATF